MHAKPETLAMVLAGGRVDELNALTCFRPKSALPFGGFARIIDFPLSNLMHSGLEQVGILSQYRSYSLINHIGIGAPWDMIGRYRRISILPPFQGSTESRWYRGTADAIYQNLDFIRLHDPRDILILSGDHVYKMDYREIIDYHRAKKADVTMAFLAVSPEQSARRFGVADIDTEDNDVGGKVVQYEEKPEKPKGQWASLTIYCFKPKILYDALSANATEENSHEFGKDIIPRLLSDNRRVYGYKFRGYWGYTRTIEEFWQTNMDLLGDSPKIQLNEWGLRTNLEHRRIRDCFPVKTGSGAAIKNSLVYNGCTVEGTVENSILFPRVHVGKGTTVRNSILFFNNRLADNCRFNKVISDVNNIFGRGCSVGDRRSAKNTKISVIGWNNNIPANTSMEPGCVLYPEIPAEDIPEHVTAEMVLR
ncbi:MAG: glucose-1-phosphate adenylyltransferase [Desulfobulbaceae bacterium]|nr:glucose-1-phosphate adenylyltransferase [Desulfobulbaceae bacterium]